MEQSKKYPLPLQFDAAELSQRSRTMRAVKSKHTAPEMVIRRLAHSLGFRFRLHRQDLPGSPDLCFPKHKAVIFVHGCFWHGHSCRRGARVPKTNTGYWVDKVSKNAQRDNKNRETLERSGWRVLLIWECQLQNVVELRSLIKRFLT